MTRRDSHERRARAQAFPRPACGLDLGRPRCSREAAAWARPV